MEMKSKVPNIANDEDNEFVAVKKKIDRFELQ